MLNITPEQQSIVETVEKLLRLATGNANENEAANATAKAQELLAAYNLDISTIEQSNGAKSKRSDEKMAGGLYTYQRELWQAIAGLNFCMYWNQYVWDPEKKRRVKDKWNGGSYTTTGGYRFVHRVVGRQINVISTRNMAQYLEQTIERLTRNHMGSDSSQYFTNWAISYRVGIAKRVQEKIYAKRREILAEEQRKQAEATRSTENSSTALTISSVTKFEYEANLDFLYGEGYCAQQAIARANRLKAQAEADAALTQWAKNNPEEARKREAEYQKNNKRRTSWNAGTGQSRDKTNYDAYRAGYAAGDSVSIDPQVEAGTKRYISQ